MPAASTAATVSVCVLSPSGVAGVNTASHATTAPSSLHLKVAESSVEPKVKVGWVAPVPG